MHDHLRNLMRSYAHTPTYLAARLGMSRRTFFRRLDQGFTLAEQTMLAGVYRVPEDWLFADDSVTVHGGISAEETEWTHR